MIPEPIKEVRRFYRALKKTFTIPSYRDEGAIMEAYAIKRLLYPSFDHELDTKLMEALNAKEKPTRILSEYFKLTNKDNYEVLTSIITVNSKSEMDITMGVLYPDDLGNGNWGDDDSCFGERGSNRTHVDSIINPLFEYGITIPIWVKMTKSMRAYKSRFIMNCFEAGIVCTNFYGALKEAVFQRERDLILMGILSEFVQVKDIRYIYTKVQPPYYTNAEWVAMVDSTRVDEFRHSLRENHEVWCTSCGDETVLTNFIDPIVICRYCDGSE